MFAKKHYNKEVLKLHKFLLYSYKILPFFEKIELKNIFQNNLKTFDKIDFYNNHININSKNIKAIGNFKINNNYSNFFFKKLQFQNIILKKVKLTTYITKKFAFLNSSFLYNNHQFYAVLKINDNKILDNIAFDKLNIPYSNFVLLLKNCSIIGELYLNEKTYKQKGKCSVINIKNKFDLLLTDNNFFLTNKVFTLYSKKSKFAYNEYNLTSILKKINLIYSFKEKYLITDIKNSKINYHRKKDYNITLKNIAFNYNLNDKNIFFHAKNVFINNDINASSKEFLFYKNNQIYFTLNQNRLLSKIFNLNNNNIKGNKKKIFFSDLKGKIFPFNIFIKTPQININKKTIKSPIITFNDINLTNNQLIFNKNYIFKTHISTKLNKKIYEVLNYFKINLPTIKQLSGKNDINATIIFKNKKNYKIKYSLYSSFSNFLVKNLSFSYSQLLLKGNQKFLKAKIKNFIFPYKYLNSDIDSNITINLDKKYLNSHLYIKKLNIDKYLQIKNFKEKIVIDLLKKYIYILNSSIFINLNNFIIYFYDVKKLLKYSPFNSIFKSGEAIIKPTQNNINIYLNTYLNYPLILNQKNPTNLQSNINIDLKNNNINIQNEKINVNISNFNIINANLKNLEISLPGLIKIINDTEDIINKININNSNDNNFTATINAINTNFIYKNHKFLTQKAHFIYKKEIKFNATYKKSILNGYTKNNYLLIEGKNYNKEALLPLIDFFKHFYNINLDFVIVKSPDNFYTGKIFINKGTVKNLAALNNIIAFINTIPSLLSFQAPGFSAKGYKIKNGFINFLFYKNILYFKQIDINGINLGFSGKGYINLNKNVINLKLDTKVKFKIKNIPILGKGLSYLFFGKDGYLHIKILIKGNLDNPNIKKDLGTNIIKTPLNLLKRILTLPFNIF